MCGIIGYSGARNPKDVIVSGLKRLEYRGYDSAGLAILNKGEFKRLRAEGKLINLEEKLVGESFDGKIGIGHTRWATHGVPSETNAHPHCAHGVTIVHNGIIENYQEIRQELLEQGALIESETDSELIAHLIGRAVEKTKDLKEAVKCILPKLEGAYSIVALWQEQPNKMVAFKNGPPMVMGAGDGEVIIASDLQAVVPYTKNVVFLEDKEVLLVEDNSFEFFDKNFEPIHKPLEIIEWNEEAAEKQGYKHFMLKEIYEQPRAVAQAMEPHIDLDAMELKLTGLGVVAQDKEGTKEEQVKVAEALAKVERIFMVACGTSYYAGMVGEYLIEKLAGVPVEIEFASEFRYRDPVIPNNSLVIVVSQSGETADTLASLRMAKEKGAKILSICNVKNSSIDREADYKLYMKADLEIGVASTKAFTCTLTLFNILAVYLGKIHNKLTKEHEAKFIRTLQQIPSDMEKLLAYDKYFAEAADTLKQYKGFLYLGRDVNYPIALEGALKLKELAYMHAEGYAAGEMKHGPIALIDDQMAIVVVLPSDKVYDKTLSNLEEVRARGGNIIAIGTGENERLKMLSKHYLAMPSNDWKTNPILSVIPLQLLAYHVAESKGLDVDQPRNLAKSVTVE